LSNVPSLSTAVLNAVINLSNLGLTATILSQEILQAIYFDPGSESSDFSEYVELYLLLFELTPISGNSCIMFVRCKVIVVKVLSAFSCKGLLS
jgi:hypothetical protein